MNHLCPKCSNTLLVEGKALTNTLDKEPREGNTVSLTGPIAEVKCPKYGYSIANANHVFKKL